MFTTKKIAIVSVINDLATDNRVNKTCLVLQECGYDVLLIGRRLPKSMALPDWPFKSFRMLLYFTSGPLFYLFFNCRLFFKLLFNKSHLLYANDLDTLLPNYLVAKLKGLPLIYDSHELFCEVPELQNAPFKRKIWSSLEEWIVPNLKNCITVNESIATIFERKYGVKFVSVRNISEELPNVLKKTRVELNLPTDKKIILMQGAGINIDRGAEELIEAMQFIENAALYIIGSGDVWDLLRLKISELHLEKKVQLISKIPKLELMQYTLNADIGLSIDKDTNLNYKYSLPNKIFDYIQAELPILASRLPEIENLVNLYQIGDFIENHEAKNIAKKINELINSSTLLTYKKNTKLARQELTWSKEKQKLMQVVMDVKL